MHNYKNSQLWLNAFQEKKDGYDDQRKKLTIYYEDFRSRVQLLVNQIHKDMPDLTVHDITHLDALWWTASEIVGDNYPLNPAEAFVLGGGFLLHDAGHCIAAYPGGLPEITKLDEWKYFCAIAKIDPEDLQPGSTNFQLILFDVLRVLHPRRARELAKISWTINNDNFFLIQNDAARESYADAIGIIAESHWSSPTEIEKLSHYTINPPSWLQSAPWSVDILKIAAILRTADAAHIDAQRAPKFLFALIKPGESSLSHWQFQTRMHQIRRNSSIEKHDLTITGSAFPPNEQEAWWMAYDASKMIDSELRAMDRILIDYQRPQFAARSVAFSYSPEAFSRNVPTEGWHPVDTSIKITGIKTIVERFGGEKLYGADKKAAMRELIQNSVDAIHACRCLGALGSNEGSIDIKLEKTDAGYWLHISDTGIGMSRYVLTDVLLDFGKSLWSSPDIRGEWSNLPASGFKSIGQFGIGFFSIFMLGDVVKIITRRYEQKQNESSQWLLAFSSGTDKRPILSAPEMTEKLTRHGTRVSVLLSDETLEDFSIGIDDDKEKLIPNFIGICKRLTAALDINLYVQLNSEEKIQIISANDWKSISPFELMKRINPEHGISKKSKSLDFIKPLFNSKKEIVGRCTLPSSLYHFYPQMIRGIGVVNGLYAGKVDGIEGLIFSKDQSDLARKTAIPDIEYEELKRWAEEQKNLYINSNLLSALQSAILMQYGVSISGLVFGKLMGEELQYVDFIKKLESLNSLIIHIDDVVYDEYEDDCSAKSFDANFIAKDNLFEIKTINEIKWLNCDNKYFDLEDALLNTLTSVWGGFERDTEYDNVVGYVEGYHIERESYVVTRKGREKK